MNCISIHLILLSIMSKALYIPQDNNKLQTKEALLKEIADIENYIGALENRLGELRQKYSSLNTQIAVVTDVAVAVPVPMLLAAANKLKQTSYTPLDKRKRMAINNLDNTNCVQCNADTATTLVYWTV